MNTHVMFIISVNLPASELFDKRSNIEHKVGGMALLKHSNKYRSELLYHQQSYYFAHFAISHYFFSYSQTKFVHQNVLLPFLLPLLQFLRQHLQDLPACPVLPCRVEAVRHRLGHEGISGCGAQQSPADYWKRVMDPFLQI